MIARIGKTAIDFSKPIRLAQTLAPRSGAFSGAAQANAFGASAFTAEPVRAGDFVGATAEGGPLNFLDLQLNPHGNGTHTESVGHIATEAVRLVDALTDVLAWALVVEVLPERLAEKSESASMAAWESSDLVLTQSAVQAAMAPFGPAPEAGPRALVLRTGSEADRRGRNWTGSNPPYLEAEALAALAASGWQHLLLDLPSVDRESDGGLLAGHKAWWRYPGSERNASGASAPIADAPKAPVRRNATITEMIVVPDGLPQGWYAINLQIAPMGIDASPSNPVLLPVV